MDFLPDYLLSPVELERKLVEWGLREKTDPSAGVVLATRISTEFLLSPRRLEALYLDKQRCWGRSLILVITHRPRIRYSLSQ